MSLDDDLTSDVNDELFWDPKVDSEAIAVSASGGEITLRGTVGSLREKREARKAAQRVFGVISVDNQLQVRLLNDDRRADAELRGDVLQALMLDSFVPKTVDAKVEDGFVTLTGTVDWQYQRDEADFVASSVAGLLDVFNEIELKHPTPKAGDVQQSINNAFERNAALDANQLWVSTHNGTVTIKGNVRSWAEHDEALDAAWAAPGVTSVDDAMTVAY
jgi:osmotically-inducible protein OsmY